MKIVVCGGGISGLAAAYYSAKFANSSAKVILLEKSKDVGGWMKTAKVKDGGGPINELGPRSVRTVGLVGRNSLEFVSDLKLDHYILPVTGDSPAVKNRLIYYKDELHVLPNSLKSLMKYKKPFSKHIVTDFAKSFFRQDLVPADAETMYDVGKARFGEEITDVLFSAFVRGVFAADHRQLSMKAAFPAMWAVFKPKQASMPLKPSLNNEGEHLNHLKTVPLVRKALDEGWKMWATTHGFSHFNEKISDRLQDMGVDVIRGAQVTKISEDGNKLLSVQYQEHGQPSTIISEVDHVISALPSFALSDVLRNSIPSNEDGSEYHTALNTASEMLDRIAWVDVAVVNLEYEGSPESNLPHPGFGHLVPSSQPSNTMGVIYDSCCFPRHDRIDMPGKDSTRLTCMMGGSWFPQLLGVPENVSTSLVEELALSDIRKQLGITKDPTCINVTIQRKCIPTYRVGHTDTVEEIQKLLQSHNLHLVGNSYWGVSVNDCIYNSRVAATRILSDLV